jgi:importin subunit alpha-1
VADALSDLVRILREYTDEEVQSNSCYALSMISEYNRPGLAAFLSLDPLQLMIDRLNHCNIEIAKPALYCLSNIAHGDEAQTQLLVDTGCIHKLMPLLTHECKDIRKVSALTLSNITGGSQSQILAVLEANVFPIAYQILRNEAEEDDIKIEAMSVP